MLPYCWQLTFLRCHEYCRPRARINVTKLCPCVSSTRRWIGHPQCLTEPCFDRYIPELVAPYTAMTVTLLDLLSTTLILHQTAPYLRVPDLLHLGAASKAFRILIHDTPQVFRYLDLSTVKDAGRPADSCSRHEECTDEEFFAARLNGIFWNRTVRRFLHDVQTLVLDGLSVPADLVRSLLQEEPFNIRILSIRQVKHLNQRKLIQLLRYLVRSSRSLDTPKIRGIYVFGSKGPVQEPRIDSHEHQDLYHPIPALAPSYRAPGVMSSLGAQIGAEWNQKSQQALISVLTRDGGAWAQSPGRMLSNAPDPEWAGTLQDCLGTISFDAILCRGPRHDQITSSDDEPALPPAIAAIALGPHGCQRCHTAPEGPAIFGKSPSSQFPLLAPPPLHSSSLKAAQQPSWLMASPLPRLFARCEECIRNRWCERCNKWWCEDCYTIIKSEARMHMPQNGQYTTLDGGNWGSSQDSIKVHLGLCIEDCLVGEMMVGAGSNGMWG